MLELIKEIREETGAGIIDIKEALNKSAGNKEKALIILKKKGLQKADKKANRLANEGVVVSYVHANGKSGALVKILCETDFVAKNSDFQKLANDIAMQIVAMNPVGVLPEDIQDTMVEGEIKELENSDLTEDQIKEKIDNLKKDKALYTQAFIKDPEITIGELIKDKIATIGENIKVAEFVKFDI